MKFLIFEILEGLYLQLIKTFFFHSRDLIGYKWPSCAEKSNELEQFHNLLYLNLQFNNFVVSSGCMQDLFQSLKFSLTLALDPNKKTRTNFRASDGMVQSRQYYYIIKILYVILFNIHIYSKVAIIICSRKQGLQQKMC